MNTTFDTPFLTEFKRRKDIESNFDTELPKDIDILLAWYGYGDYCGDSLVVYRTPDGQLYEVNASHCSCNGLEGQWQPEATTVEALRMRDLSGSGYGYCDGNNEAQKRLTAVLDYLS